MIIGVCGKSGSGKSTLSKSILKRYPNQAIYVEIDKVGHNALDISQVQDELVNVFGKHIIDNDKVNRKSLGDIVFSNRKDMEKLTTITWKYMQIEIDKIINNNKDKIIILDWLLLPKTKYLQMCDIKILLDIPYEVRKQRTMKRDKISERSFDLREKASIEYDYNDFDFIIKSQNQDVIKRMVKVI